MDIVDDEEVANTRSAPWPARVERYLEGRPWLALGASVLVLTVIVGLVIGRPGEVRTMAQPTPALQPPVSVAAPSMLPGLAFQNIAPIPGAEYDLLLSITSGPPSSGSPTVVYRLDAVSGGARSFVWWPASEREPRIFADPRGHAMVVAGQDSLIVFGRGSAGGGPPLDVVSVLFLGPDHDPAALVLASTSESVVDVTRQGDRRVVANVGGTLLGRLDDGRVVLASMIAADLLIRAVALDGTVTELGRVPQARGPAALQRFPTSASPFRVLALRRSQQGVPGSSVLSGLDLSTGAISDLQVLGLEATFAPETGRPGVYVYAHRSEPDIEGRGTPDIKMPAGRWPLLDPLRSWSPDGALIAFRSLAPARDGVTALTRDGRLIFDLQPDGVSTVTLIGWVKRT